MKLKGELKKELDQNDHRVLRQQRRTFRKDLVSTLNLVCYLELIILYYADNSLMLLLIRSFVQFIIGHPPPDIDEWRGLTQRRTLSTPYKKNLAQKVLTMATVTTVMSLLLHVTWLGHSDLLATAHDEVAANDRAYQYGHFLVTFVGERRFSSRTAKSIYLCGIDLLIVCLQIVSFGINYGVRLDLSKGVEETSDDEAVSEYDGYQGNLLVYRFKPFQVLRQSYEYSSEEMQDATEDQASVSNTSSASSASSTLPPFGFPGMPGGLNV